MAIVVLSLEAPTHPAGTGTVSASFEAVGPCGAAGDATGLGEPAGVGLGTSPAIPELGLALLPRRAIDVPQPAMTTTRPTTAAMMSIHGVRWTGAWGAAALGA